jgi:hypothetical protein
MGLFDRFPFLTQRLTTMNHLVTNRKSFLDMFAKLLETVAGADEPHLIDTFEYIRMSTDDILRMEEHVEDPDYVDHPLDSIALGVLEARSFLFNYEKKKSATTTSATGPSKLQRSQSERRVKKDVSAAASSPPKKIPARPKCAKFEKQSSLPKNSKILQNKFLQHSRYDS